MNDIDYRAGPSGLEVFQKRSGVTAVGIGGIYAFGGEVIEFLEIGIPVCAVGWGRC